MKFIDWFAGIGGFRRGMELAGHECVGFCEFDKYAVASYTAMHLCTPEQIDYLKTLPLKERQKEIAKDEYRNGEWYANDIREVRGWSVPKADCWCFGAPCQDFSTSGNRSGLKGDRSSLVKEIFRIIGEMQEEDRPEWLLYENVKGMLSSNNGFDFLAILLEMDRGGTMSSGKYSTLEILESHRAETGSTLSDILDDVVDQKYYLSEQQTKKILSQEIPQ